MCQNGSIDIDIDRGVITADNKTLTLEFIADTTEEEYTFTKKEPKVNNPVRDSS